MMQIRSQTALLVQQVIQQLRSSSTQQKSSNQVVNLEEIVDLLEIPKNLDHGHLSFPAFGLAKELRKAPPLIAKDLVALLNLAKEQNVEHTAGIKVVNAVGGYLNFTFSDRYLQDELFRDVYRAGDKIGFSSRGQGQTLVIDYSSPNVAKPMHIGHLRATVIGQAIRNLAATQGYHVIGLNHLGDWGVQFGKLAWAYERWGKEYDFAKQPFESLFKIYVRFHEEAEKNPNLEVEGSLTFKKLEQGDAELQKLWRFFVDISLKDYTRIWQKMGVKHDLIRGESFYNDKMQAVEDQLSKKGLLEESEGATVVRLGDDMPPCLIRKSDGASLYATRDLASAIYRHDELKADLNLYVVGSEQTLHFKQVFKVLELMGFPWSNTCHHIGFGMYRFKDGKMSTRSGRTIFLEDVLSQATELVEKVIAAKNPNLANKSLVAEQVGLGAVIFNDLMVDRVRDVEFDWEKVLNFEGDSGPYVQYMHVRCVSLMQKYQKTCLEKSVLELNSTEERELVRILLLYQETLHAAFEHFRPNILAQYLLEVCGAFSRFYNKHRILGEDPETEASRMALVAVCRKVLAAGLGVLGVPVPSAM